jgi:hypothetical protein
MHKESWLASALARPTLARHQCARTATTDTILTRARLMATTGLVTSQAEFLSAPGRGSMDFMDARASTVALGFMVVAISMIAGIATLDADTTVMASAAATSEAVAIEENFEEGANAAAAKEGTPTAAEVSMVEVASTVAGAGKFHFQAASKQSPNARYLKNSNGWQQRLLAVSFSSLRALTSEW